MTIKTKDDLKAEIATRLPSQNARLISPQDFRIVLEDMIDSLYGIADLATITDGVLSDGVLDASVVGVAGGVAANDITLRSVGAPARITSAQELLQDGLHPAAFGTLDPTGVLDSHAAIEGAIQEAIGLQQTVNVGAFRVRLPPGAFSISEPIRGYSFNGSTYALVSFGFEADAGGYQTAKHTEIIKQFNDNPGLILQGARSVRVAKITIRGQTASTFPTYEELLLDSVDPWFNPSGARDERYSPDCAIHVDPFSSGGVPSDGGLPGFSDHYTNNGSSSTIVFEDVGTPFNVVGIALGLGPLTQQCDNIYTIRPNFSQTKVGLAVGQDQSRGNTLVNPFALGMSTLVDTMRYGKRTGIIPTISGGVIGYTKWLLLDTTTTHAAVNQLYVESLWSLGVFGWDGGGEEIEFNGCKIKFIPPDDSSLPGIDSQGHFGGAVTFRGGYVGQAKAQYRRQSFYNLSTVTLDGVSMDGEPYFSTPEFVRFKKAYLRWAPSGRAYGIADRLTPGTKIGYAEGQTHAAPYGDVYLSAGPFRYKAGYEEITVGSVTMTVDGIDGTATFTSSAANKLQVGNYLSTVTAWNAEKPLSTLSVASYALLSIGRIQAIVGNDVTLNQVPISLVTGTFNIRMYRLPIYRPTTTGDTTNTSADITNVSPITYWVVGDRIKGAGIPSGAWVTAKAGTTLTISIAATATNTGTSLYDALLEAV